MTGTGRRTRCAGLLLAGLVLAGCGSQPELHADTAAELQDGVLAVTEAAAAGRYDDAAAQLAEVRSGLESAVDEGHVSATRYRVIDDALDRASTEVAAARDAAAAEQAAAEQAAAAAAEQAAAEQAAAEQAAAEQAAAEQAAAEQAAAEQAGPGRGPGGPGDDGPGRGNGKGNGKGNGEGDDD
ncbi:mucin-associated surface protein [Actinotalea ferrariae]|uniref:mucin-associated surface protein n=1 Tax=Actinotalea ferrariae TaxID=1386098 RepID=UPI001C8C6C1B|nr:mucin-associated surface protein [Actinotalea ferrariae]MBX9244073.1 mucin-associated surface protein [Actinotalea ferrariae]